MERIEVLITRLKEQYDQKADPGQMMVTVQLLESELANLQAKSRQSLGTSKVSVVLPRSMNMSQPTQEDIYAAYQPPVAEQKEIKKEVPVKEENGVQAPEEKTEKIEAFDPLLEIPTLSHQKRVQEINESVAVKHESLNDRLKQSKIELVQVLKETPIRDLRKAIGINDRFVFISELFRGDEAMYERSIKTINSFTIYAEAEYWINRELKTKIGWDERKDIVQHFYQLIRRRFA